jgi:hypothetical protein
MITPIPFEDIVLNLFPVTPRIVYVKVRRTGTFRVQKSLKVKV